MIRQIYLSGHKGCISVGIIYIASILDLTISGLFRLIIGNFGQGNELSEAQIVLWAVLTAPHFTFSELRTLSESAEYTLKNEVLIYIYQYTLGIQGKRIMKVLICQLSSFWEAFNFRFVNIMLLFTVSLKKRISELFLPFRNNLFLSVYCG